MVQGRKVLILQSDSAASFPLSAALRQSGWAVVSAGDAATAMSVARQQKPDAVVLSSQLAGGGGLLALKRLRSSMHTALIPVIGIVHAGSAEEGEMVAAGAQETIEPPGNPQAIADALRRYLVDSDRGVSVPSAVLGNPERTKALQESNLLDSPYDEAFDRLVRLSANLIGVPTALASVVDKERQFFKSHVGLPEKWATARQTPLSHSFCQWVVGGGEEVAIVDAREHPVLRSNLAIRDLGVVAYAGVPFALDGQILGSFCAIDTKPRAWDEGQLTIMRDLGSVLEAFVVLGTRSASQEARITALARGIAAASRLLLEKSAEKGRLDLCLIVEQLSHRLVQQMSGG